MTSITHGWILTRRELLHWAREPWTPIVNLAFSIMLLLMFGFLFGGAIEVPGGGDYISYLLPGMIALTMMFGLEGTRGALAADAERGVTDRFRSLPIGSAAVSLGRAGADMITSVIELAVLVIGGLLIGWRIDAPPASVALGILLLLWFRFAMLWFGIFLALALRSKGGTMAVQLLVWPIGFLSTVFVSAETMPVWLRPVAELNPISATATAARQLFGNPTGATEGWFVDAAIPLAIAWPAVLVALFVPLSARAWRRLGS